jgi:gluconate 5-dehydrogenase
MIDASTFRLDGRLALVTGSSAGIGLALARGLGQAGSGLVLNGRDASRLQAAAEALRAEGLAVHAKAFDVTDAAAVDDAVAGIESGIGPIEILVNNAGIQRRAPFQDFPADDWQDLLRTNVHGPFVVAQAVSRRMIGRRRGRIINICSVQSELGRPGIAPYAATKGALGPGYFKTELTARLVDDEAFSAWLVNRTPSRRWGEVDELAPAAVFLASDASSFVNGHILYVDGGVTATL